MSTPTEGQREIEEALVKLEEWAVEHFVYESRWVTRRKENAWIVAQAFRELRAGLDDISWHAEQAMQSADHDVRTHAQEILNLVENASQ